MIVAELANLQNRTVIIVTPVFVLLAALFLIPSLFIHAKEKKILRIWNKLRLAPESKLDDITWVTGSSAQEVIDALKVINRQPDAYYLYESDSGRIVDKRLDVEYVAVGNCLSCAAKITRQVSLKNLNEAVCSHCGAGITPAQFNELKQRTLSSIVVSDARFR